MHVRNAFFSIYLHLNLIFKLGQDRNTKKRYTASCPISYRPTDGREQQKKNILGYIFPGYETCDSTELRDVCLQTDINMADWDDQYFESIIERFTSVNDVGEFSPPAEEFVDVIESGDEEFYSVREDKLDETHSDALQSINIQLKDSPHIILEDGMHKTKISVTPKYLEKNGLELSIGEGPARNIRLKAGDAEIYPSDKALPSGINISVTDEKDFKKKDAEVDMSHEIGENINFCDSVSPAGKLGLLSIVIDNIEQQNIEQLDGEKFQSCHAGANIVQCISDYGYLKEYDKREVGLYEKKDRETLERIIGENAELLRKKKVDPEIVKRQEKEMYKLVKNKFFKSVLEGDPRLDNVKRDLIEQLIRTGKETPVKEKCKSTQVQTEVHINPAATDEYSFSDDSDSILRRFYALRDSSAVSSSARDPPQTTADQNNSHEATKGQLDTDFSAKTELTMEGISDLTERNVVAKLKEKEDATDDDVSDISLKANKFPSITSIENRSKLVDTQDLEDEVINDVALVSDRHIKSPSLIRALKSFDEELNPLKLELTRLLSDFKSIDIPEDVQTSVAAERLPKTPTTPAETTSDFPSTSTEYYPNFDQSIHHLYRTGLPGPLIRGEPCHCAPGTCLGFGRSSGIICQRIRRLPASASSSEFFREFTRPDWISGSFRHHSILSEPEDIYGDRVHRRRPSSMSIHDEDMYNKPDSK